MLRENPLVSGFFSFSFFRLHCGVLFLLASPLVLLPLGTPFPALVVMETSALGNKGLLHDGSV